jgi:hypothetical protein
MSLFSSALLISQPTIVTTLDFLIIGGGGSGGAIDTTIIGQAFDAAGGGGAGGFISASLPYYQTQGPLPVIVGPGAPRLTNFGNGVSGSDSSFFGYTAYGGGGGGGTATGGLNGGSGGGGGVFSGTPRTEGIGTVGQGNNGAQGYKTAAPGSQKGGPGGGASTAAINNATTQLEGQPKSWLDGNYYSRGGYVGGMGVSPTSSLFGNGGTGRINTVVGTEAGGGVSNGSGSVVIRYPVSGSLFTGGTITYSGSYTYHSFTSSGVFDYKFRP